MILSTSNSLLPDNIRCLLISREEFPEIMFAFFINCSILLPSLLNIKFFMSLFLAGYTRNFQKHDLFWQEAVKIVITSSYLGNHQDCKSESEIGVLHVSSRGGQSIECQVPLPVFILCHTSVFVNCTVQKGPQR